MCFRSGFDGRRLDFLAPSGPPIRSRDYTDYIVGDATNESGQTAANSGVPKKATRSVRFNADVGKTAIIRYYEGWVMWRHVPFEGTANSPIRWRRSRPIRRAR